MTNGERRLVFALVRARRRHNRPVRPADEPVLRYTFVSSYFLASSAPLPSFFLPSSPPRLFFLLFIAKGFSFEKGPARGVFIPNSHCFPPPFARLYVTPNSRVPLPPRGRRLNELFVYFQCIFPNGDIYDVDTHRASMFLLSSLVRLISHRLISSSFRFETTAVHRYAFDAWSTGKSLTTLVMKTEASRTYGGMHGESFHASVSSASCRAFPPARCLRLLAGTGTSGTGGHGGTLGRDPREITGLSGRSDLSAGKRAVHTVARRNSTCPGRADNFTKRAGEKKRARIPRDPRSTGDRRPDISQRLAMRSLLGINEAIISCHRSGIGVQQHPHALSLVLATNARGCATIYFPLRYTRHIARTVVQLALDEIGIARWHNARDTTSPAACSRVLHHHRHRRCCCLFHLLLLLFLLLLLLFPLLFNFSTSLFLLSGRFLPSLSRVFVVSFFFFYFISPLFFFFFFFVPRARSFPERYRYTV